MLEQKNLDKTLEYREQFDIVTARAVARFPCLLNYVFRLVKIGGIFIAMKAASAIDELKDAKKAIQLLGSEKSAEYSFLLPMENSERTLYVFAKIKSTPKKYPRKPGIPNKSPII